MIVSRIKNYRAILLFLSFFFLITRPTNAHTIAQEYTEVDAYVHEVMRRFPIDGMAIGIVKGSQIFYLQGYGTANNKGERVSPQTPFMLASLTKTFTALAARQLAESGKWSLDDSVRYYLPEFRLANEEAAVKITIRDLINHTSGISQPEGIEPYLYSVEMEFTKALERLAKTQPQFLPGSQYEYSNWNYILLGKVIERASGVSYQEYIENQVLDPLEMDRSSFEDYHSIAGHATGNTIVFGVPLAYDEKHIPLLLSTGYLTSTAEDMAHYMIPYFNQGQYRDVKLLSTQGQGWFDPTWTWHSGIPEDISYSYSGGHTSFNTAIQLFSFHQVGVVVLMNTRLDTITPGPDASEIAFNIARIVIGFPYEIPLSHNFYLGFVLLALILMMLVGWLVWQVWGLNRWLEMARSAPGAGKAKLLSEPVINLLTGAAGLVYPYLIGSRWDILLCHRAHNSIPFLVISCCLLFLGGYKQVVLIRKRRLNQKTLKSGE